MKAEKDLNLENGDEEVKLEENGGLVLEKSLDGVSYGEVDLQEGL